MECSYCNKEAVTGVGLAYCEDHLGYFESTFFENVVSGEFNTTEKRDAFFVWAFGSSKPKLSDLQKWHDRIPRKERPPEEQHRGIYVEKQDMYIRRILDAYLASERGLIP